MSLAEFWMGAGQMPDVDDSRQYPDDDAWAVALHGICMQLVFGVTIPIGAVLSTWLKFYNVDPKNCNGLTAAETSSKMKVNAKLPADAATRNSMMAYHKLINWLSLALLVPASVAFWWFRADRLEDSHLWGNGPVYVFPHQLTEFPELQSTLCWEK